MMEEEPIGLNKPRKRFLVGVAIISGLLVGFGIGQAVAADDEATADNAIPAAVEEIHAAWYAAWNDADGSAVNAMMAPGGRHYCAATGTDGASGDELAEYVRTGLAIADVEAVGAVSIDTPGSPPGTTKDHIVVTTLSVDGHPGYVAVLHLRGPDDDLEVLSHRAFQ